MAKTPLLDGIRVLDFATVGPAARCSRALADYGAQVVKVAAPSGVQRQPPYHSYAGSRGMRRIQVDLKAPAGKQAFLRLAAKSDVIVESFRPGVMNRLGVGFAQVREHNRGIVYCSTTGYGQDGPHSQWAGHDINYLAMGGLPRLHDAARRRRSADSGRDLRRHRRRRHASRDRDPGGAGAARDFG